MSPIYTIYKIDAAKRQLITAIELWFNNGDSIAIHTLACAAHQIIHDINKQRGIKDPLYHADFISEDSQKKWYQLLNEEKNFFKHADKDPEGIIVFNPEITEPFILASLKSINKLEPLDDKSYDKGLAFSLWHFFHGSCWFNKEWYNSIIDEIPAEELKNIQKIQKVDFLFAFLRLREIIRFKENLF